MVPLLSTLVKFWHLKKCFYFLEYCFYLFFQSVALISSWQVPDKFLTSLTRHKDSNRFTDSPSRRQLAAHQSCDLSCDLIGLLKMVTLILLVCILLFFFAFFFFLFLLLLPLFHLLTPLADCPSLHYKTTDYEHCSFVNHVTCQVICVVMWHSVNYSKWLNCTLFVHFHTLLMQMEIN